MKIKFDKESFLKFLLIISVIFIGIILIGLTRYATKPHLQFIKEVVFNNNTVFLYKVEYDGEVLYYLCPLRLPEGRKCIVSPTNLVCEFTTPCVRIYTIIE